MFPELTAAPLLFVIVTFPLPAMACNLDLRVATDVEGLILNICPLAYLYPEDATIVLTANVEGSVGVVTGVDPLPEFVIVASILLYTGI